MIYMFLSNNPLSGDIKLLNLSCLMSDNKVFLIGTFSILVDRAFRGSKDNTSTLQLVNTM